MSRLSAQPSAAETRLPQGNLAYGKGSGEAGGECSQRWAQTYQIPFLPEQEMGSVQDGAKERAGT